MSSLSMGFGGTACQYTTLAQVLDGSKPTNRTISEQTDGLGGQSPKVIFPNFHKICGNFQKNYLRKYPQISEKVTEILQKHESGFQQYGWYGWRSQVVSILGCKSEDQGCEPSAAHHCLSKS